MPAGQTTLQNDLPADTQFAAIEMGSGVTITGNSFAIASGGSITVDSGTATIAADVALDGPLHVHAAGATLAVTGTLTNDGSSTGSIAVAAGSTVVLSSGNTYTGPTTIHGTLVLAGGDNCLSASSPIAVEGGTLDLGGGTQTTSETLTFPG